jgi:hypothetical protein
MPMPGTCTAIALAAGGAVDREVGLATHYHADYVVPALARQHGQDGTSRHPSLLPLAWILGHRPAFGATEQVTVSHA